MTNTKHTPAPWEYNGENHIVCSNGDICSIEHSYLNEAKCNARLIAAAPELLEALEAMYFLVENIDRDKWQGYLTRTRAAIAKAKGV